MQGAQLTRSCRLFPQLVDEVGIRCVNADLFAWVKSGRDEHLLDLPDTRLEAQDVLSARLVRDHGFTIDNGLATTKLLFELAFIASGRNPASSEELCPGEE